MFEALLVALVGGLGMLPLWLGLRRSSSFHAAIATCVVVLTAAEAVVWSMREERQRLSQRQLESALPGREPSQGFVSSSTCQACHPAEYKTWHASYHRSMTQVAAPGTVIGDWNGVELELSGQTYYLKQRGDEFLAQVDAPVQQSPPAIRDPRMRPPLERRIALTTGSHHMQVYWMPSGAGNLLDQFPFAWLVEARQWVPVEATMMTPAGSYHQLDHHWNTVCILCHTVAPRPQANRQTGSASSKVAELGISCEACHGPAEEHVRANRNLLRRYETHWDVEPDPTIVHPGRCSPARSSQICGQCHGISSTVVDRLATGDPYRAGDDLEQWRKTVRPSQMSSREIERIRSERENYLEGQFWSDGMVRVSGREYNGLIDSACHQLGGMSCLSCHSMHDSKPDDQLAQGMETDQACYQCHRSHRERIEEHTHHPASSSGSRCYNCHMPHTTYGLLKAIRSHRIDSPTLAASLETGRPNSCNLCHLDRTLAWTGRYLTEWYGHPAAEMGEDEQRVAAAVLWLLKGDAGQRALIAWSAGWGPAWEASGKDWLAPFLGQLLTDPYAAVRFIAGRSLRRLPGYGDFDYDFVASPAKLQAAQQRAWQIWDGTSFTAHPESGSILMHAGGGLRRDEIDRLYDKRDDRPVLLFE